MLMIHCGDAAGGRARRVLDLSYLTTQAYPLDRLNDALEAIKERPGGFTVRSDLDVI